MNEVEAVRNRTRELCGSAQARHWVIGIGVLALGLRLLHLGNQQLWLDEAFSYHIATVKTDLAQILGLENSPPLYYLLLRLWVPVAGNSELALRLPSALAGTLAVLAIIWAGGQMFSPAVGLWAGGFAAIAPIQVYYSQETRVYALLTLEFALVYGCLWRAMRLNTWLAWLLVSLAAAATLYSHYLAALGLIPAALILWVWPRDAETARRRVRLLIASLLCLLLFAPWVLWAFVLTPGADVVNPASFWADLWNATPPAMAIPRTMEIFALGPQRDLVLIHMKQFAWLKLPEAMRGLGVLGLIGLAVWVIGPWQEENLAIAWLARRKLWAICWLLIPLGSLWLLSLYRPLYVPGRYDQIAFVPYAILMGLAVAKLQRIRAYGAKLALAAMLMVLIAIGTKLAGYYHAPADREAETTARALHLLVQNGDIVVLNAVRGISILSYYLPQLNYQWSQGICQKSDQTRSFTCRMFPPEMEKTFIPPAKRSPDQLRADVASFLSHLTVKDRSLWVLLFDGDIQSGILRASRPEDLALVRELVRVGYQPEMIHFEDVPALYRFQPYSPGLAHTGF